jgi:hypothetical protein
MTDLVNWNRAAISWNPEGGYLLRLPHSAESRAVALREGRLSEAIRGSMPGRSMITTVFSPMVVHRDEESTRAEPGEIVIGTETMITLSEAGKLRNRVAQALDGANDEAEQVVTQDNADADAVLSLLKQPPQ